MVAATADEDRARLRAQLEWDPAHEAFPLFPFPHRLEYEALLTERSIEITVTLAPTGETARFPVSFGFHPYLRIPGGSRADARMTLPVRRRLVHDELDDPHGESEPFEPGTRSLGDTVWDDGFAGLVRPGRFLLSGREHRAVARLRAGLSLRAGVRAPGQRLRVLRADDRARERAGPRRARS